jgi:cell division protein FtsI/penicillin-binding protein 2
VAVTPMQMINAISTIANNGVKVTPHVIKYSDEETAAKISVERVMSEENAKKLTKILYRSIENSTAPEKMDNYYVAAKTGASRKLRDGRSGYYEDKLYASIIGYLPATNPQILIYVIVDSAQVGPVWGATVAAPVFKEVASQVVRILNIPPDKIKH